MPDNDTERSPAIDALVVSARTDRESFGRLYEAYYDKILRYCLRRLYTRCVAEDVCSDVFLFVTRSMRSFRGVTEQDFRRWVYSIATTEVNAWLRRTKRRRELWDNAVQQNLLGAKESANHAEPCESSDWSRVYGALAQLNTREQTIVTLRLFEGMSYDEIANVLNIRAGAARVAYSRAIRKLRDLLAPQYDGPREGDVRRA